MAFSCRQQLHVCEWKCNNDCKHFKQFYLLWNELNIFPCFSEKQIFEKFKKLNKVLVYKRGFVVPLEDFTSEVALLLNDVDANNLESTYDFNCDIITHPKKYLISSTSSFIYKKDFALKEVIDHQLQRMKESGQLTHLGKKYFKHTSQNCEPPLRELSLSATFFCFAILSVGVLASIVCFIAEKIIFKFKK